MRSPKYPLEHVATVRDDKVERSVRDLASAIGVREAADRAERSAERRLEAHDGTAAGVRGAERCALETGTLRAADLAQGEAWEKGTADARAGLAEVVRKARTDAEAARGGEALARGHVASRKADAEAVARDRSRWSAVERKKREEGEDEAQLEAWRPKTP